MPASKALAWAPTTSATPCDIDADCAPYEDGDLCNGTLRCVEGACQADPDTRVVCVPSLDACRQNLCVAETGQCQLSDVEDGASCDDGNPCTSGEACAAGACEGGDYVCDQCESDADCADFDDADLCKRHGGLPRRLLPRRPGDGRELRAAGRPLRGGGLQPGERRVPDGERADRDALRRRGRVYGPGPL